MKETSRRRLLVWGCLILAIWTLAVYWRALDGQFLRGDDEPYVTKNAMVLSGINARSVTWAFSLNETQAGAWQPLTSLSHMLDVELFGLNPTGHHAISILFHVLNTLLLFLVLVGATGGLWRSAVAALLFALHPLHVESVAWIASRKDVLSTFFWLLTMGAYSRYARHPRPRMYFATLLFLALGLMSKPMVVTLPFVLLLMDYWPLKRVDALQARGKTRLDAWTRLVTEKAPMFVLAVVTSILTFKSQQIAGAVSSLGEIPLPIRLGNALAAYAGYLGKTFLPRGLSPFYPLPETGPPVGTILIASGVIAAVSGLVIWQRKRRYLTVGWLWYLGTLVPVIGIVQIGNHAMADRFTYVPLIGIFMMLAWLVPAKWIEFGKAGLRGRAVAAVILLVLSGITWVQIGYWRDTVTLYTHALKVNERDYFAQNNLAQGLQDEGRFGEAAEHYRRAIQLNPDWAEGYSNLGTALARLGKPEQAVVEFDKALDLKRRQTGGLDEHTATINYSKAMALIQAGKPKESIEPLRIAVRIDPNLAPAQYLLGKQLEEMKDYEGAIHCYRETLRVRPESIPARNNLAVMLFYAGDYRASWEAVHKCRAMGFEPAAGFIRALSMKMPDPGGGPASPPGGN
jgi:tetratricopeptide (TPR) repeat protein